MQAQLAKLDSKGNQHRTARTQTPEQRSQLSLAFQAVGADIDPSLDVFTFLFQKTRSLTYLWPRRRQTRAVTMRAHF